MWRGEEVLAWLESRRAEDGGRWHTASDIAYALDPQCSELWALEEQIALFLARPHGERQPESRPHTYEQAWRARAAAAADPGPAAGGGAAAEAAASAMDAYCVGSPPAPGEFLTLPRGGVAVVGGGGAGDGGLDALSQAVFDGGYGLLYHFGATAGAWAHRPAPRGGRQWQRLGGRSTQARMAGRLGTGRILHVGMLALPDFVRELECWDKDEQGNWVRPAGMQTRAAGVLWVKQCQELLDRLHARAAALGQHVGVVGGEFLGWALLEAGDERQPPHVDGFRVRQVLVSCTGGRTTRVMARGFASAELSLQQAFDGVQALERGDWRPTAPASCKEPWPARPDEEAWQQRFRAAAWLVLTDRGALEAAVVPLVGGDVLAGTAWILAGDIPHAGEKAPAPAPATGGAARRLTAFAWLNPPGGEPRGGRYHSDVQWTPWAAAFFLGLRRGLLRVCRQWPEEALAEGALPAEVAAICRAHVEGTLTEDEAVESLQGAGFGGYPTWVDSPDTFYG